ncbi:MAG: glycosyltransferase family 2 protein [bacterium]|nr:glycosyltransferase family 2 protein [bacterium]
MSAVSPQVTVGIPTYNYGRYLPDSIGSVLHQSFEDWELVICDNASTDDTRAITMSFLHDTRIRYEKFDTLVPMYANFNRVIEQAHGEFVLCLCADDMLKPDTLQLLVNALESSPSAALACMYRREYVSDEGVLLDTDERQIGPGLVSGEASVLAQLYHGNPYGLPSEVLVRTAAVREVGGFDAAADHCGDADLWTRLAHRYDVVMVENATSVIRRHVNNATAQNQKVFRDIESDHRMFIRLFRESPILKGNRRFRRIFIRHRTRSWFWRSIQALKARDLKGAWGILRRIASFDPIPWWILYFSFDRVARHVQAR